MLLFSIVNNSITVKNTNEQLPAHLLHEFMQYYLLLAICAFN